jgi:magnesium transporter
MKNIYYKTIGTTKLSKINKFAKGCWIDIQNPLKADLDFIQDKFGIESEIIEDILDTNEIPKVEKLDENLMVILKMPVVKNERSQLVNFTIIISPTAIITISLDSNPIIDRVIKSSNNIFTSQRSKLFIKLLQELASQYQKDIEKIRREIEIQKKRIEKLNDKQVKELILHEEALNSYNLALQPTKYIINKILKGKLLSIYSSDEEMLNDMYEDFNQAAELCLLNLKSIVTLRDSYKILIDLALNKTIKFLTSITIILTIPTIISSIFGMNVEFAFLSSMNQFEYIMQLILLSVLLTTGIFYYKKWL